MPIMHFLVTCAIEHNNYLFHIYIHELAERSPSKGPILSKRGSQAWGGVKFFLAVTVPILINCKDVVTLLGNISPVFEMRPF